MAEMATSF